MVTLTGKARVPSAVETVVMAVSVTRFRPACRIAASRFLRTLRLSRATSVRESPAAICTRFDAPTRSPEIRRTDRARHASSQPTLSRRPRLITDWALLAFGARIEGRLRVSPWTPTLGGGDAPGLVTVMTTESLTECSPSLTVSVAV